MRAALFYAPFSGAMSATIGYISAAIGAVVRTLQAKLGETVSVKDFGAVGDGVTDDTLAFTKMVAHLILRGGGIGYVPIGNYLLLGGAAGPDGYKNGVLLPDTDLSFLTQLGVTLIGEGVDSVLLAGSNDMIVIRGSRLYSGVKNLMIKGNGKTNVWAGGIVPEDMTQVVSVVSQSFQNWDCYVEDCDEGIVIQPGPQVLGSDSGCFYHNVNVVTNNVKRAVWTKNDVTSLGNRVTRSNITATTLRGNTGIHIHAGSELVIKCNAEFINQGILPNASPTAVLIGNTSVANIRVAGYAESCTKGLVSLTPEQTDCSEWNESGVPDASTGFMSQLRLGKLVIAKLINTVVTLSFGNPSYVRWDCDYAGTGQKTLALVINDAQKDVIDAAGKRSFIGSLGAVEVDSNGAGITFTRNSVNTIKATGVSASIYHDCDFHGWRNGSASVDIASLSALEFIPRVDGATSFGIVGFEWKNVVAKTADITGNLIRIRTAKTPATAGAAGNAGEICWDANYVYVCIATNTWKRSALTTW